MTKLNKSRKKVTGVEIGVEMMSGAAAAMLYSEEEIRDIFSREDADEFMELRRLAKENFAQPKYEIGNDCNDQMPMAAEEEPGY